MGEGVGMAMVLAPLLAMSFLGDRGVMVRMMVASSGCRVLVGGAIGVVIFSCTGIVGG